MKTLPFCVLCVLCGLSSCSRTVTDTYLPAPPTPEAKILTLEKQPTLWEKTREVMYKFWHPGQIGNDKLRAAAKILPQGHG